MKQSRFDEYIESLERRKDLLEDIRDMLPEDDINMTLKSFEAECQYSVEDTILKIRELADRHVGMDFAEDEIEDLLIELEEMKEEERYHD